VTSETLDVSAASVLESIRGTRDGLSTRRVFGDPIESNGTMVIPLARVVGGSGGGSKASGDERQRRGRGTTFGFKALPVGVFKIRDGRVEWRPAVDITRIVLGGEVLLGLLIVCRTLMRWRRHRAARQKDRDRTSATVDQTPFDRPAISRVRRTWPKAAWQ
jgi:uncharacterized spore protein YtfJ